MGIQLFLIKQIIMNTPNRQAVSIFKLGKYKCVELNKNSAKEINIVIN